MSCVLWEDVAVRCSGGILQENAGNTRGMVGGERGQRDMVDEGHWCVGVGRGGVDR